MPGYLVLNILEQYLPLNPKLEKGNQSPRGFQELIQGQINAKLAEGKNVLDSIICKQNKKFHNINPSWQVSTGENVLDSIIYKQNEKFHNINPSWE